MQEAALGPRTPGNQSRRFPPSENPTGPPSATGVSGQPPAPIIKIAYLEMLLEEKTKIIFCGGKKIASDPSKEMMKYGL